MAGQFLSRIASRDLRLRPTRRVRYPPLGVLDVIAMPVHGGRRQGCYVRAAGA